MGKGAHYFLQLLQLDCDIPLRSGVITLLFRFFTLQKQYNYFLTQSSKRLSLLVNCLQNCIFFLIQQFFTLQNHTFCGKKPAGGQNTAKIENKSGQIPHTQQYPLRDIFKPNPPGFIPQIPAKKHLTVK
ncbi:Hypothetical_protein [Hexamita inflata]|uniref:Hypothetical_protein n=1 Tax=Hexamita inflata TaxID=28002 RepID=A0AA86UE95_9EUKA|nr:Hypothetical protein HINF_LOCUS25563 [Hexamita inflata]